MLDTTKHQLGDFSNTLRHDMFKLGKSSSQWEEKGENFRSISHI